MIKRSNSFKLLLMLVLGTLLGAVTAYLFAPRSGRESRARLVTGGLGLVGKIRAKRQQRADALHVRRISNWGNYPRPQVTYYEFEDINTLRKRVVETKGGLITRGNGRCYGDSALAPTVISTLKYNKFLSFDDKEGLLRCQAGVLLSEVLDVIVPKGWFLPVTPGTKLITVGGAIASNVHGKSQHKAGNFDDHVVEMDIMLADGSIVTCSHTKNTDLFWTTGGGMGLTGVILHATLKLIPIETAYFRQESIKATNLQHLMDLFEASENWSYSVAWIDCLERGAGMGRGFIMRGEHATLEDVKGTAYEVNPLQVRPRKMLNVPVTFPGFVLNTLSMRIFNMLIYYRHPNEAAETIESYNTFFYPLDFVNNWNKMYGKNGFTQYQFILPKEHSREGLTRILEKISGSRIVSNLGVLKLYKDQNGYLPFAIDGYALALDFPIKRGVFAFLDELDQIVLQYGGRLYLAKDVRMNKRMFMQSYPNVERFIDKVREINQDNKFRSFQSDRVGITE